MEQKSFPICDLHIHSNCSDGSLAPEELIALAAERGVRAVALCDHNTVAGLARFEAAAAGTSVIAVPAIEVTAGFDGHEVHIVGLFADPSIRKRLTEYLAVLNARKLEAIRKLVEALADHGYDITVNEVWALDGTAIPNRVHVANALIKKGYVRSVSEAFGTLLSEDGGYYRSAERLDVFEVIAFLRSLHMVPIVAHPLVSLREALLLAFLPRAKEAGLVGMEVYYSTYTPEQTKWAEELSVKFGLLPSGGSDFHGKNKPDIAMGTGKGDLSVPFTIYEDLYQKKMSYFSHELAVDAVCRDSIRK